MGMVPHDRRGENPRGRVPPEGWSYSSGSEPQGVVPKGVAGPYSSGSEPRGVVPKEATRVSPGAMVARAVSKRDAVVGPVLYSHILAQQAFELAWCWNGGGEEDRCVDP